MLPVHLFLCGDVMTGRGIDQILPTPGKPLLHESYVHSAVDYVTLAERKGGPIPRAVAPGYIWGDALAELEQRRPDARLVNLETAVTTSEAAAPGKAVHYRMHPANVACLTAARVDYAGLANNHVLDWGQAGLAETLATLQRAGIAVAGAGRNEREAARPAILAGPAGTRVLVFALAMPSAGTPAAWAATHSHAGVCFLPDCSDASADRLVAHIAEHRRAGDVVVVSIHWGPNWGYTIDPTWRSFAHTLIDRAGVDVVHGHSSHHPMAIELHAGKPIFYGCGDFINDYEGIGGYDEYRPDLALMYFVTLDPGATGGTADVRIVPLYRKHFRLYYAREVDIAWVLAMLGREGAGFGVRAVRYDEHTLRVTGPAQQPRGSA